MVLIGEKIKCTAPPCRPIIGPGERHDTLLSLILKKGEKNEKENDKGYQPLVDHWLLPLLCLGRGKRNTSRGNHPIAGIGKIALLVAGLFSFSKTCIKF